MNAAPHAPEVGRLARLLGRFHVTGTFWYRLHLLGVRIVPQWLVAVLIRSFTAMFFFLLLRIRRAIAANLEVALGPAGWLERQRRIHRTMLSFAWCLTERYERLGGGVAMQTRTEDVTPWHDATSGDRGVVLVTAHVGNWEIGSSLPSSEEHRQVHLVREEEMSPEAQRLIRNLLRERMGDRYTTHFASGDPALGLRLVEVLRAGEIVALQADRPRAGGRTIAVELFGRPFHLPAGPLVLARTAGVALLPAYVLREGRRRYRICFGEPLRVGEGDRELARAADALARSIEWAVLEAPDQWFCFRSLWDGAGNSLHGGDTPDGHAVTGPRRRSEPSA